MKRKNFNFAFSMVALIVGALFIFSDEATMTGNVIGAGDGGTGFAAIIGLAMIIGAIGLFMITAHNSDMANSMRDLGLERLVRRNANKHEHLNTQPHSQEYEEMTKQEESVKT